MPECPQCGDRFEDEHGHGLCFGCKIRTVGWGRVPQGPSKYALEAEAVADARAAGIEPERPDPNYTDRRDKPRKLERPKVVEEMYQRGLASQL